jgi:hypothetical protein
MFPSVAPGVALGQHRSTQRKVPLDDKEPADIILFQALWLHSVALREYD